MRTIQPSAILGKATITGYVTRIEGDRVFVGDHSINVGPTLSPFKVHDLVVVALDAQLGETSWNGHISAVLENPLHPQNGRAAGAHPQSVQPAAATTSTPKSTSAAPGTGSRVARFNTRPGAAASQPAQGRTAAAPVGDKPAEKQGEKAAGRPPFNPQHAADAKVKF